MKNIRLFIIASLCGILFGTNLCAQDKLPESQRVRFNEAFVNGSKEKILENADNAIQQFEICMSLDPNNAAVLFNLADLFLTKRQYDKAALYAEKAVKTDPANFWYKELLVDIYISQRKQIDAAKLLVQIARQKQDAEYFMKASYVYAMGKDYPNAIKVLNEVEKMNGVSDEVSTRKEQLWLAMNKPSKAMDEVKKLIRTFPGNPKYEGMLADLLWSTGKTNEAIDIYKSILGKHPENGFALFALADYHKLKSEYEQWYDYLKRGMASQDVESKAKISVLSDFVSGSQFSNQQERTFELATIYSKAHPNDLTAYLVLGDVYQQQRKFDSARLEYRKALQIDPSNFVAWQQTVFSASQLYNNDTLLGDCEEAIVHFPNEPAFYAYGAIASMQLKKYAKAIDLANNGLIVTTPDQKEIVDQLMATLGDAYHYIKNYKACDSVYEAMLTADPENTYALNNYAYFLSLRKTNLEKAAAYSKKTLEKEADNASYLDTYGWILFVKGDYENAKKYIEQSLVLSPENAEVVDHLGDVLYKLQDVEGAVKQWMKAKQLGSENEKLDQKIKDRKLYE
jgi:tetratricopeptide (TPR) repeat protein